MDIAQIIAFIRTVPIFHQLGEEQFRSTAEHMVVREFKIGEIIIERGQEENELLIVVAGELQLFLADDARGMQREISRLYPGDYIGISGVVSQETNPASVRVLQKSKCLAISRSTIHQMIQESPSFALGICKSLASHLRACFGKVTPVPFANLETYNDLQSLSQYLPTKVSRLCKAVVVDRDPDRVIVAMVNPNDERQTKFIRDVLRDIDVEFVAITEEDYQQHTARLAGSPDELFQQPDSIRSMSFVNSGGEQQLRGKAEPVSLLQRVLSTAIEYGASDIHIEPTFLSGGRIRIRIDGKLMPFRDDIPIPELRQMISRLKVMADLNITNVKRPQDGRFLISTEDQRTECRVSSLPCLGGEKVAIRLIAEDESLSTLSKLFFDPRAAQMAEDVFSIPSGLILVTGPTGAGKTTTLYAGLNFLFASQPASSFVTIEDPVEYNLDYATQFQVDDEQGMQFADILKSVLRQDPDVILVGEIRDKESAAIAVEAATTGHLVLSSLHTHSALETIARLRHLEVPPYLLASALRGVISQRLVPRLCEGYTEVIEEGDPVVADLKEIGVLTDGDSTGLRRGVNLESGPDEGELGRVGVFEVLRVTDRISDLIDRTVTQAEMEQALEGEHYLSFAHYSRSLMQGGVVSPDRIEKIFPKKWRTYF